MTAQADGDRNGGSAGRMLLVMGLAFAAGAAAMAAAAGVYWLAFLFGSPVEDLISGTLVGLALDMAVQMAWLIIPAAVVGSAVCLAAWKGLGPLLTGASGLNGIRPPRLTAMALVAGALVTMTVGQSAVVAKLGVVLIKEPVPLRHPLVLIPAEAGPWKLVREDPPLPKAQVEELGTEQYISRIYEDTTWPEAKPGRLVRLHVAYYTGTTDTVPHVPDRCFVAGGVQGLDKGLTTLTLSGENYRPDPEHGGFVAAVQPKRKGQPQPPARVPGKQFEATYFTFGAPTAQGSGATGRMENVIYFFAANGKFLPTPNHVRAEGFDTHDKYSYYCKVEVQLFGVADKDLAAERASAFLSTMLPEVMACLPDWVDVTEGRWPAEDAADAR